jgi:hypothetical protein
MESWKQIGYRIIFDWILLIWHCGALRPTYGGIMGDIRQFQSLTFVVGTAKMKTTKRVKRTESFAAGVGRGLRLAAKSARKTARMYGTPIYISEEGKVVAKKP